MKGERSNLELLKRVIDPKQAVKRFTAMFENIPAGEEKEEIFLQLLDEQLKSVLGPEADVFSNVADHLKRDDFEDDTSYIEAVVALLYPYLAERTDPSQLEQMMRKTFVEKGGFIPLNEILSFGHYKDVAHIHLAPSHSMGLKELKRKVTAGFEELAKRLASDNDLKDIQTIQGTSWIVARSPKLMESFGFTIDGEISDEMRQAHFSGDDRPIARCHMDRETFLKRYLNPEDV